ncbi:MAG: hypothetical protein IIC59_00575 [Proteobacteria bacterium]|nr:hypothetical protein [Pseudomonadota bacterium]
MGFSRDIVGMGGTLTVHGNLARNPQKNDIFPAAVVYARIVSFYNEKGLSDPINGQKPEPSTDTLAGKWTSNLNLELLSVLDGTAGQDLTAFGTTAKASWEELKKTSC